MNTPIILQRFKTDGILKYNVPVEDTQPANNMEPVNLVQDIERFENDEMEDEIENNDFLNTLLNVQNVDNGDIRSPRGNALDESDEDDIDLNTFDFDNELGEIDTI